MVLSLFTTPQLATRCHQPSNNSAIKGLPRVCRKFLSTNGDYFSFDSSVGILTRPGDPRAINYGSIPSMVDRLSLSSVSRPAIRARKQPVQRIPGLRRLQGKGGLLVPRLSIRGPIHPPPPYILTAWCLISEKFYLYFHKQYLPISLCNE